MDQWLHKQQREDITDEKSLIITTAKTTKYLGIN